MKTIKIASSHILLLVLMLTGRVYLSYGQQDSQFTQYMYNTQTINPSYAGNRGVMSFNGLYRNQWVGLDGAPEILNFSMNTPIGKKNMGLGLSLFSDKIGPSIENNIAVDFSYAIRVSSDIKLSFGLKGGVNLLNVNYNKLNIYNTTDANFSSNIKNRLSPIIGAGLYLNDRDTWYFGVSSPNLLRTDHYDDLKTSTANEQAHFYAIGGYVFNLNTTIKFKPAILTKIVSGAPLALDLSANFIFNEKFTLGVAYRLNAATSALAGFQITEGLMIGYAYDYDITELSNYNHGSHEVFLRFELRKPTNKIVTPRFF